MLSINFLHSSCKAILYNEINILRELVTYPIENFDVTDESQLRSGRRYYKAVDADNCAKQPPKLGTLELNSELRQLVMSKLELKWSPEKTSDWLSVEILEAS